MIDSRIRPKIQTLTVDQKVCKSMSHRKKKKIQTAHKILIENSILNFTF